MIKGVNKKIIEINNPESPYFDKVILYIKPNREVHSSSELAYEVDKYLKSIIKDKHGHKSTRIDHAVCNYNVGVIIGMALILVLIVTLILV